MCEGLQEYKDFAETRNVRELLVGLTHEIGNSLQAIRSELDLLTLSGAAILEKIAFRQEHRNQGVFSILIKVPAENKGPQASI